ncbi:glycoside hydrolase family 85 protein [Sparassis crispa]|uniref:Glycoside hydrolase family 85 protein n=1 Tax=Sparassis crispa TaxID=139825 RepID=A0A401GA51_9APHY|nr:glycoside hydrolase family 85 protein [Sparassis crispa]GBE79054.1 glycoside hydrolase family 85 protein [Sparassis crispa]
MPLRGTDHCNASRDDAPYFDSLVDLDAWAKTSPAKLNGVLDYHPRQFVEGLPAESRGNLLVCHDYKGGYTESPSSLSYTFNLWSYCNTFIYFSHHRVTIPPSGWTTAAHRHGVKMLGTLIFEDSGEEDCLRLLIASRSLRTMRIFSHIWHISEGLTDIYSTSNAHYADNKSRRGHWQLGLLCCGMDFNGKLVHILKWYDSVIYNGQLRWQDRLNNYNLPFFIPSSAFFTNYTWPPDYPSRTAQYFLSLDTALVTQSKFLRDIFVGVDVWGRGSHGGGGFGSYKAISHIDPEFLGLSVALFGQAWTWESEQDRPGWTWESWWEYERKLWLGPQDSSDAVTVPESPLRRGELKCEHGPFVPLASFFPRHPPPNPAELPFFTSFSPGVGRAWFINGAKVLETTEGWTDLDKNCSLGDMTWPRPVPQWEHGGETEELPKASSALCMDDAWLGGSSLRIALEIPGSDTEDAFFRCIWLPVQSLAITPRNSYEMSVVFKVNSDRPLDFDLGLSLKVLAEDVTDMVDVTSVSITNADELPGGWIKMTIHCVLSSDHPSDVLAAAGLVVGFAVEDPTEPILVSISLGALCVRSGTASQDLTIPQPKLLWADFHQMPPAEGSAVFAGTLTWDVGSSFTSLPSVRNPVPDSEDPRPVWQLDSSFPVFSYFNIFAQVHSPEGTVAGPDCATFIGTTGLDGRENRFYVDSACLPLSATGACGIRFYVQGVTDWGLVLDWESSTFVDVKIPQ